MAAVPNIHHRSIPNTITINSSQLNTDLMSDDLSDDGSSPDSTFDSSDLMETQMTDDITSQLAAAGPIGVAAAAAINSGRRRRRPHLFETNPAARKRQQTRLLRKLRMCIEEYTTRVGQQAIVLCCTPSKNSNYNSYKVFGSQPLENVIKNAKTKIMQDLDQALADQAPNSTDVSGVFELPTLALDGIPTPVDKMTQGQLRTFIPEMLKYSTSRSKPGWGKQEFRPIWWPNDVPWANVRSDVRTEDEKKRVSWTEALRAIVKNCYKHHGREDMLNIFGEDTTAGAETQSAYVGTMVQTINNPDGTVSIIQIDTGPNSVVTLPDGSQATVVHSMTAIPQENINQVSNDGSGQQMVHTEISQANMAADPSMVGVQMAQPTVELPANINISDGRIVLANGETLQIATDPATGMMTIPMSVYQRLVGSQQQGTVEMQTEAQVIQQQQLDPIQQQVQLQQHQQQMMGVVQQPGIVQQGVVQQGVVQQAVVQQRVVQQGMVQQQHVAPHLQQQSQLAQHLTQNTLTGLENVNVVSVETIKQDDIHHPS